MTEGKAIILGGSITVGLVGATYLLLPAYRVEAAVGLVCFVAAVFIYRLLR
jgi:uncharacterized membrane protein